jgi:hypothetical protein
MECLTRGAELQAAIIAAMEFRWACGRTRTADHRVRHNHDNRENKQQPDYRTRIRKECVKHPASLIGAQKVGAIQ